MKNSLILGFVALVSVFHSFSYAQTAGKLSDFSDSRQAIVRHTLKNIMLPNAVQLQYAEQGDERGIPVIFLHGYTDSWHSFEKVLPYLTDVVHVYAITLRGHGNSSRPPTGYNPADFAADIAAFMEQLHIKRAFIVGHSMGATIAQRFALQYPRYTWGLTLAGTITSFPGNPVIGELSSAIANLKDPVDVNFINEFQKSTLGKPVDTAWFNTLVNESTKVPAFIWKATMYNLKNIDYSYELKNLHKPTLILWGDKDGICPQNDQFKLFSTISGSELKIYDNTGHAIHWEEPKRFADDLQDFIHRSVR